MAIFDKQDNATISLHELHDILAQGLSVGLSAEDKEGLQLPNSYILDFSELPALNVAPNETTGTSAKDDLLQIVVELNELRNKLGNLDSRFHDIFDGAFC